MPAAKTSPASCPSNLVPQGSSFGIESFVSGNSSINAFILNSFPYTFANRSNNNLFNVDNLHKLHTVFICFTFLPKLLYELLCSVKVI
uniref:Uncharacterized protein n=1 Tax=Arundo donax TaxID=35708 RepID=A0A0A9S6K8_ARUDO